MTDAPDMELVRQFARDNSEAAFTELVRRHINLVYSVAHRCTRNDSDAQDVTQAVFITLARKAATLREKTLLAGRLYETTRFTTARLVRTNALARILASPTGSSFAIPIVPGKPASHPNMRNISDQQKGVPDRPFHRLEITSIKGPAMIAPLAKFIDWSALQMASAVVGLRHAPKPKWQLEEALEFLKGPDFIPAASDPARIEFDGPRHFKFPTPRPSKVEENNIVYGRLYRCAERWRERPAIILLDGAFGAGYHSVIPLLARQINRTGFNAAALVASNSLQRRPRRPIEDNCLEFAREMAQNVAEIRALTGWLLAEGCPSVGLAGGSLGGWTAALTACSDTRIACAVLAVPGVRMRFSPPVVLPWVREALQALRPAHEAMDTTRLNLILSMPVIPKEDIWLIEAIHDLLAERQPIEELWQKWEQPEIWRLPHGHISALFMPGLTGRVLRWLAPRLEAGRKDNV